MSAAERAVTEQDGRAVAGFGGRVVSVEQAGASGADRNPNGAAVCAAGEGLGLAGRGQGVSVQVVL